MQKINIDQESSFELEMEIHGDVPSGTKSNLYFTIISEKMRLSFEGERVGSGVYKINIPVLKNILEAGKYDFEVNVLIDGKYFSPITESLELIEEIKPVVKMKEAEKPNGGISVKINESIKPSVQQSKEPIQVSKKVVLERIGIVER